MINKLIKEIKKKKGLGDLDSFFIKELIEKDYIRVKDKLEKHSHPEKSKEFKLIVKKARKTLHDIYGVFNINKKERLKLLKLIKKDPTNLELHERLLKTHRSSKERLSFYENLYKKILNKNDKTILDIGCGLNPISYIFMKINPKYIAIELTDEDCNFIKEYFKIMKIKGKVTKSNLLKTKEFPKADMCFLFKILDSLEEVKKGISKEILKKIDCKRIIVSFPTRTISGKNKIRKRNWFEKLIRKFYKLEFENEVFYIFDKKNVY